MSSPDAPEEGDSTVLSIQAAVDALDPDDPSRIHDLAALLDQSSTLLARSDLARQFIGNASSPRIWPVLSKLWNISLSLQTLSHSDSDHPDLLDALCVSIAKFTRNLVAANPRNQQRAFNNESVVRSLIYHYTSHSATQNSSTYPITRILTQALSNIITKNDQLAQNLWLTYLHLPEEQLILTRLLASPDPRTLSSAFVLVINCIHDSVPRTRLLIESPRGPRTCIALLDRIAALFEAEPESEQGSVFDLGYEIFCRVFEAGLSGKLYTRLAVEDEAITPHQTTLLKLLDSWLHSSNDASSRQPPGPHGGHIHILNMLTDKFLDFSAYVQRSIRRALGSQDTTETSPNRPRVISQEDGTAPLREFDLLLPKVCEALVLATQCLTTITLRAEEAGGVRPLSSRDSEERLTLPFASPKTAMAIAASSTGQGLVECLIETLRLVDLFVPRITYGKVVGRPTAPGQRSPADSSDSSANAKANASTSLDDSGPTVPDSQAVQAAQAFAHVKRDLVRLLGILASHGRAVQDRVRECGGIPVVMNLCVVDDYNPYLREHAIFALRNLLYGNADSQAAMDAIQPVGRWDEDKILRGLRSELNGLS